MRTTPTTKHYSHTGFARGWFVISFSNELAAKDVKPIRYFGQDLVLFRTESGAAKVLDAHCSHLGAHLGHGGVVTGETVRCPFHFWKFKGDGTCSEVPYAKKIPPKSKMACWPVCEKNGVIFVWHDRDKGPPEWEVPDIEGARDGAGDGASDAWTPWNHGIIQIKTHPHAIAENVADSGHFIPVHGTHVDDFQNIYDGHTATQIAKGVAYPLGGGKDRFENRATYYGPGFQISEMSGFFESRLLNAHTPIEENLLDLRFAVLLKKTQDEEQMRTYSDKYVENLREGFFQDVRIWEHKRYVDRPVLCDGDGPIMKLRKWYRQFYEPALPAS